MIPRIKRFQVLTFLSLLVLLFSIELKLSNIRRTLSFFRIPQSRLSMSALLEGGSFPLNSFLRTVRTKPSNLLPAFLLKRGSTAKFISIDSIDPRIGRRIKSLVWEYDGCPVLVILDIVRSVDVDELARHCHVAAASLTLAPRDRAKQLTGYDIGTVPPLGLIHPMRTIVDAELLSVDMIYAGSGEVGVELFMPISELLHISGAEVLPISKTAPTGSEQKSPSISKSSSSEDINDTLGVVKYISTIAELSIHKEGGRQRAKTDENEESLTDLTTDRNASSAADFASKPLSRKAQRKLAAKANIEIMTAEDNSSSSGLGESQLPSQSSKHPIASEDLVEGFVIGPFRNLVMHNNRTRFYKMLSYFDAEPVKYTVELDSTTSVGKTALHLAAWRGPAEFVVALLDRGADINKHSDGLGNYGKTAIFYAITRCRDDIVTMLLQRGAHVRIVNNKGQTPLSLAASHLREETIVAIEEAEERQEKEQKGIPWVNFRESHSDGQSYGDLDPRFLDPPLVSPTGRIRSVNPTSTETRRERYDMQQVELHGRTRPDNSSKWEQATATTEGEIGSQVGSVVRAVDPAIVPDRPMVSGGVDITAETVALSAPEKMMNNSQPDTRLSLAAAVLGVLQEPSLPFTISRDEAAAAVGVAVTAAGPSSKSLARHSVAEEEGRGNDSAATTVTAAATTATTNAATTTTITTTAITAFTSTAAATAFTTPVVEYEHIEDAVNTRFDQLRAVPIPCIDAATGLVHLVGVVVSKRHIGKSLVFANIVPPRDHMTAESLDNIDKYTWLAAPPAFPPATALADRSLEGSSSAAAESSSMALQIIIGKTMRTELGEEITAAFCRNLKPGQLILAVGRLGANGERGEQNLREFRTLDMVVSRLRVLQENYLEVLSRPVSHDYTTSGSEEQGRDYDYAATSVTASGSEEQGLAEGEASTVTAVLEDDNSRIEKELLHAVADTASVLPVLILSDIIKPPHLITTGTTSDTDNDNEQDDATADRSTSHCSPGVTGARGGAVVTVVKDLEGVRRFAKSIRDLAKAASLNAMTMSTGMSGSDSSHPLRFHGNDRDHDRHPHFYAVVGLDCEWRPSSWSGDDDYPVETLQLATREEVFVLDMQSLCGGSTITAKDSSSMVSIDSVGSPGESTVGGGRSSAAAGGRRGAENDIHHNANANSHPPLSRFPVRVIETETEAALCAALGELFTHRHIAILGFSVGVDLQRLAASFPHLPCFGRVMNVVDLAPLSRHAFPPSLRSSLQGKGKTRTKLSQAGGDLSLTKLCQLALGRRLDKTQQCSPWHIRPLTKEQIEYAALDAAVLPRLLDVMLGSSALSSVADIFAKVPKLCLNHKFTFLRQAPLRRRIIQIDTDADTGTEDTTGSNTSNGIRDQEPPADVVLPEGPSEDKDRRSALEKEAAAAALQLEEEEAEDRLLRVRVQDGKVRKILGAVMVLQSWSSSAKKEPKTPDVSQSDLHAPLPHGMRAVAASRHKEKMLLTTSTLSSLDKGFAPSSSTADSTSLSLPLSLSHSQSQSSSLLSSRAKASSKAKVKHNDHIDFTVQYQLLRQKLGAHVGKSKYACLQYCLTAAKASDKTIDTIKITDKHTLDTGTDNLILEQAAAVGEEGSSQGVADVAVEGDDTEQLQQSSTLSDNNNDDGDGDGDDGGVTMLCERLEASKAHSLLTANDRSGVATLGDSLVLFVNCFDVGAAATAGSSAKKYANQFLLDGRYFTWFIDAKRWSEGASDVAKKLLASRTDASGRYYWEADKSEWVDVSERPSGSVFLFARQGSAPFVYCGHTKVVEVDPPSKASRSSLVKITFELIDFETPPNILPSTSTISNGAADCPLETENINSSSQQGTTITANAAATTAAANASDDDDNLPDENAFIRGLHESPVVMHMVRAHNAEMAALLGITPPSSTAEHTSSYRKS